VFGSNVAAFMFQGSYLGFQFILTLYLQRLLGWSALQTACAILPAGALVALIAPRMGAVIGRAGTAKLMVVGFVLLAACYANMLRIGPHGNYPAVILPSMLLVGLSFVITFPCINIQATSQVRDAEQGMAAGLVNASFQIGAAVGLAGITAVVIGETGAGSSPHSQLVGYRAGLAAAVGIAVLGLIVVAIVDALGRVRLSTSGTSRASATAEPIDERRR
jgi:Na+/melibiose symporter-like transporter